MQNPDSYGTFVKGDPKYENLEKTTAEFSDDPYHEDVDDDIGSSFYKGMMTLQGWGYTFFSLPFSIVGCGPFKQITEGQRGVILRFGKFERVLGPGTYHYNVGSEKIYVRSIQIKTIDVPRQEMMTSDNLTVMINAVVYYRIEDVRKAIFNVLDCDLATSNIAQSLLRTVVGQNTLEDLFHSRQQVNSQLTKLIDEATVEWGVRVSAVEIKDIAIPESLQRVMASVAEATREGHAKVISAEAEKRAASTLTEAADIMSKNPITLQLRYFQTLTEIASEKSTTIIVPSGVAGLMSNVLSNGASSDGDFLRQTLKTL